MTITLDLTPQQLQTLKYVLRDGQENIQNWISGQLHEEKPEFIDQEFMKENKFHVKTVDVILEKIRINEITPRIQRNKNGKVSNKTLKEICQANSIPLSGISRYRGSMFDK
jgi:hypothetical protein